MFVLIQQYPAKSALRQQAASPSKFWFVQEFISEKLFVLETFARSINSGTDLSNPLDRNNVNPI